MKIIQLTKGYSVMVDDEDYEQLSKFKWHIHKPKIGLYAIRTVPKTDFKGKTSILMHRQIMGVVDNKSVLVDHKDRNGLNCQKDNLRLCDHSKNRKNQTPYGASKYLGVTFHPTKRNRQWEGAIVHDKKRKYLGYFENQEDAARAYDEAAKKYHGEFANLNFK